MILRLLIIAVLAGGLAGATTLHADVDWSRGGALWMNQDGTPVDQGFVGVVLLTLNDNGAFYYRDTICADLFTDIYVGDDYWYGTTIVSPDAVGPRYERVAWLLDNVSLTGMDPVDGEAIQFAAWDIIVDGGDGFSTGRVQASSDGSNPTDPTVLGLAEYYESISYGMTSNIAFVYENTILPGDPGIPGDAAQMLEGPSYGNGPQPVVPEPSTFALGGAGLAAAACLTRRGKNRRAS